MKHTEYLKKKKRRESRKRIISILAAFVVFVATYALVLPALTLDVNTARMEPGMSVQQSADPEAVSAPESSEVEEAEPEEEKSVEAEEPADEEKPEKEEASSVEEESAKDEEAAKEEQASDEQAGSAAAQQEESDKKEDQDDAAAANTDAAAESVDQTGSDAADENAEAAAADEADAFKVPELEAIDFSEILTDKTDFYYYHVDKDEDAAAVSSTDIDDWKKVKDDTVLAPEDFVRVYLAYAIPASALNETNAVARYRLPDGLELTDKQIKAINKNENGISGKDKDAADYKKYLGAEAIEGTRTPDKDRSDDEYISATVKAEKVYKNDKYVGQDLIFTFAPYTVQKNQIKYDEKGTVKSEGKAVKGWFSFDLTPSRIGFEEIKKASAEDEADEEADNDLVRSQAKITFVKENEKKDIDEISRELTLEAPAGAMAKKDQEEEADEQKTLTYEGADYTVIINYTESAQIPDNAELAVSEIEKDTDEYNEYLEQAKDAVDKDKTVNEARFFDITILADGEKIEPAAPVSVQINFAGIEQTKAEDAQLLHYTQDEVQVMDKAEFGKSEEPENEAKAVDTVQFETDGFSVFGILGMGAIETEFTLTNPDGEDVTYLVTVTYDESAQIPDDALLKVTEYDPESDEYVGAREKILAEKIAENPDFDSSTLGMTAVDISIVRPDGTKVEPASSVKVEINVKSLPENTDANTLKESIELQHLKENPNGTIEIENVANSYSDYNEFGGNITVEENEIIATFDIESFSTFSFIWTDDNNHENVIVHYVDVNGNEIQGTQRNDVNANNVSGDITFSSYQGGITGYTFKEARIDNIGGNLVTGFSKDGSNNRLRFLNGSTTVRDVERPYNVEVFFIYTPTDYPDGGDGPTLDEPTTSKTLVPAGDGTYTISLSVTGTAATDVENTKANVVIIYDTSNSMSDDHESYEYVESANGNWGNFDGTWRELTTQNTWTYNGQQYLGYRYQTTTSNSGTQYGVINGAVRQIYYRNGAWRRSNTNYAQVYNGTRYTRQNNNYDSTTSYTLGFVDGQMVTLSHETVYGATYNGSFHVLEGSRYTRRTITQTRHEIATDAVTSLATALLKNNTSEVPDMVELAFVDFGSLVNTVNGGKLTLNNNVLTTTNSPTTNLNTFLGWLNNVVIPDTDRNKDDWLGATDWEEALKVANLIDFGDDDPVHIVFVSDGNPTTRVSQNGTTGGAANNNASRQLHRNGNSEWQEVTFYYGTGQNDPNHMNLDAGVTEAKNILAANKKLYTVGAFVVDDNKMPNLGGKDYDAQDKDKIEAAFNDIVDTITRALTVANVKITDGITALTANTFVDGTIDPNSFKYSKGGVDWNPESDGALTAYLDIDEETGATDVKWDLGEDYMLEKGVTYTVSFVVWPKQEAYDLLAALNNKIIDWGDDFTYLDASGNEKTITAEEYESQVIEVNGIYTVMTNTRANLYYEIVNMEDGEEVGERESNTIPIANPTKGMGLDESHLDVRKDWDVSLDPKQLTNFLTENPDFEVLLHVLNDRNEYVPVTIKPELTYAADGKTVIDATWPTAKVFIAPGVMLSESYAIAKGIDPDHYTKVNYDDDGDGNETTYVVLEKGHDYTIDEKSSDWHFELESKTYHPMVVDGHVKDVTFIYSGDEISGIEAIDVENVGTIVATNKLRSGVNIVKKVTKDAAGEEVVEDDNTFYVKLTAKDKNGNLIKYEDYLREHDYGIAEIISSEFTGGYYLIRAVSTTGGEYWYYSLNEDGSRQIDGNEYPIWFNDFKSYKETDGKIEGEGNWDYDAMWESGEVKPIKQGQLLQLKNVPYGTEISITEVKPVRDEDGNITGYEDVAVNESFDGYKLIRIDGGNINKVDYNTSYNVKVYNQKFEKDIIFRKADIKYKGQDNIPILEGAQFELTKGRSKVFFDAENRALTQKQVEDIIAPTKLTDDDADDVLAANGIKKTISIGELTVKGLSYGDYVLKEVKTPNGYIVITSDLTVSIGDELSSTSEHIVVDNGDNENLPSVTIFNEPGRSLPHTGGSGTFLYTLGGIALIMASALMYGFRLRRRERRFN